MMWANKSDIYQYDFRKRTFNSLLHLPDDEVRDIMLHNWDLSPDGDQYKADEGYLPLLTCRTENSSVYVVLRDPNESFQIKVPEGVNIISNETATNENIYANNLFQSVCSKKITTNSDAYTEWYQEQMKKPVEY